MTKDEANSVAAFLLRKHRTGENNQYHLPDWLKQQYNGDFYVLDLARTQHAITQELLKYDK
jgi:hypothetical protein